MNDRPTYHPALLIIAHLLGELGQLLKFCLAWPGAFIRENPLVKLRDVDTILMLKMQNRGGIESAKLALLRTGNILKAGREPGCANSTSGSLKMSKPKHQRYTLRVCCDVLCSEV